MEVFCEHWQSQVHRMIVEQARELVEDKLSGIFDNVTQSLSKVQEVLYEEMAIKLKQPNSKRKK